MTVCSPTAQCGYSATRKPLHLRIVMVATLVFFLSNGALLAQNEMRNPSDKGSGILALGHGLHDLPDPDTGKMEPVVQAQIEATKNKVPLSNPHPL